MTTQQKISWYLDKGFAVEVEFENGDKVKLYAQGRSQRFIGIFNGDAGIWNEQELMGGVKVTPIPPNPYEFSVGERVIIVKTGKTFEVYTRVGLVGLDGKYGDGFGNSYYWYELVPALPDEEYEVVEVNNDIELKNCTGDLICKLSDSFDHLIFTKPDGKKLKIKVVKQ